MYASVGCVVLPTVARKRTNACGAPSSYIWEISTRRASALLVAPPASTNSGGFISRAASGTPAFFSASRTASARLLASSSFFAVSPVLSVYPVSATFRPFFLIASATAAMVLVPSAPKVAEPVSK